MDEIEGHEQVEHEDRQVGEHAAGQSGREQPVGEHAEVDYRRRGPPLPALEPQGEPGAGDQQSDGCGRRKTPGRSLAQDQEQAEERERAEERADEVESGAIPSGRHFPVIQEEDRQQDSGDAERNADQEETSP